MRGWMLLLHQMLSGFRKTSVYLFNRYAISCVSASATPNGQGRKNAMTTGVPFMWWIDYIYNWFISDISDDQGDGSASNKGKDDVIEGIFCINLKSSILDSELDHKSMASYSRDDFMPNSTYEKCQ